MLNFELHLLVIDLYRILLFVVLSLRSSFVGEGGNVMEKSNSAMRHLLCTHCRREKESNTALRRVQAHRWPMKKLIRQCAVLADALPLKLIRRTVKPQTRNRIRGC